MANSDCEGAQETIHSAAAELYQLAALLLGNEAQAVEAVEAANVAIDPCADTETALNDARRTVVDTALARLCHDDSGAFCAPATSAEAAGCLTDDELDAAGLSSEQLAAMLRGPDRAALRNWLNQLPAAQRAVFVERAMLDWTNAEAAASLSHASSTAWEPSQAGDLFRQALCSLASSVVHAASAQG